MLAGLATARGVHVVHQSNAISATGQTDYAPIVQEQIEPYPCRPVTKVG